MRVALYRTRVQAFETLKPVDATMQKHGHSRGVTLSVPSLSGPATTTTTTTSGAIVVESSDAPRAAAPPSSSEALSGQDQTTPSSADSSSSSSSDESDEAKAVREYHRNSMVFDRIRSEALQTLAVIAEAAESDGSQLAARTLADAILYPLTRFER